MRRFLPLIALLAAISPAAAQPSASLLESMETAVTNAIERAGKSVVAIARVRKDQGFDVASGLNFNLPSAAQPIIDPTDSRFVPNEFASGVIISAAGDVLTTFHALDDPTENEYYVWHQGIGKPAKVKAVPARVQAGDPWTDLAVLRLEANDLPAITFGNAKSLRRGSFVISLGNPYAVARDGQASASLGIVSNLQRAPTRRPTDASESTFIGGDQLHEFGTLIQTDAKLNLGTSGGVLVNLRGEMVGLTTSLAAVAGYEQSAGFAIPIDAASRATIDQLRSGRTPAFGFLGLEPTDLPDAQRASGLRGAVVRRVIRGMPAELAGVQGGDLITQVDDDGIDSARALFRELSRRPAGAKIQLTLQSGNPITREFHTRTVSVTLGKKYLALTAPGYSRIPEPSWRGMRVDHGTALPPQRMFGFAGARKILPVAIVSVTPDTPAWNAGLRPGQFIEKVGDEMVLSPRKFHELTKNLTGAVELTILGNRNRPQQVVVEARED